MTIAGWRTAVLGSLLAGVLLSLAFAPIAFGPYAAAGAALLTLVQYRATVRRGLLTGFLAGFTFFAILLVWLRVVGTDAWFGLALFCAVWFALMGAAVTLVTRLPLWPLWVAAVWVLQESLRSTVPYGGFPWGRLAFGQPDAAFGRMAALLGQPGVTFAVALAGSAVVAAVMALRGGRRRQGLAWAVAAIACVLVPALVPLRGGSSGPTMQVAIVQGGTPQTGLGAMDVRRQVLDNHVAQTLLLAEQVSRGERPQPSVVIWPENSTDIDPFLNKGAAASISEAARAIKAPILVGAVVDVPGNPQGVWNLGVLWDPQTGPGERYVKRHPVPFGEYIPMRAQLASLIGRLDRIPRDFLAGTKPGMFMVEGVPFADVICFEVAYDDVVHPLFVSDARFLTVQTNNATYGGTAQPEQQLAIERMRAIESGRPVLVAATTGVSAFIAPDGHVVESLGQGDVGSLDVSVSVSRSSTIANALGDLPEIILGLSALVAIIAGGVQAVLQRSRRQPKVGP